MNTRQEWLNNTDYTTQFYSAEETINEVKENFDIRRYYSAEGADVSVDGINCRALVQYFTNPLNQAKYDRKLHVPMDININTGSIVDYDGYKWLVTGSIDDIQAYKSAGMVKSNNTLTIHKNNTSYQIPCIINSTANLDTDKTVYIETPSTTIVLRIPNTEITRQIKRGEIYKLGLQNYEIKDINDIVESGILRLEIMYSQEVQEEHIYVLEILNGDSIDVQESTTLQLNINVYDNGILISPLPSLTFTSSNELIANVDENGLVTAYDVINNCDITVSLGSDSSVLKSININVIEVPQDNITYELLGNTKIIKGYLQNYIAKKYNNGILVEGVEFTFSVIPGSTPTSAYTLNIIDGDQCSIIANLSTYYITLRGTDDSNGIFVEKSIKLKNLF